MTAPDLHSPKGSLPPHRKHSCSASYATHTVATALFSLQKVGQITLLHTHID